MKRNVIVLILFTLFIGIGIGVGASTLFNSNQVLYTSDTTVEDALNDLYTRISIGNATASDIKSGKTALVGGKQVTGSLSLTSLSGTQSVSAGSSSTLLNGNYSLSNYKVSCGTCPNCPSCNSTPSLPFILYYGANYNNNKYRHFTVPDNYDSVYCSMYGGSTSGFYINGSQISGVTLYASKKYANTGYTHNIYKLNRNLRKGEVIGVNVPAGGQYIEFFGASVGGGATLNVEGNSYINVS